MRTAPIKTHSESSHHSLLNRENQSFFTAKAENETPFFSPVTIQPKLKIGSPDDQYEQQADRVADAVVQSSVPDIQQQPAEEEEEMLQMKSETGNSGGYASPEISSKVRNPGNGTSLPGSVNREMSQKIGADFSDVNIHTGSHASKLNQSLGARAFTHGKDIFFNSGEYNPASVEGKRLLAHELTHVVQQGNKNRSNKNIIQKQEIFDFSDEEGEMIHVPVERVAGRGSEAGEREVEGQIARLRGWVDLYLSAYRDGLNSFSDTMNFASDQEAQPRYYDVALKEVGKILLDQLINYATRGMPIVGPVVSGAKSVLTEFYNEAQRAQAAEGETQIRSYIVNTRNSISEEGGVHRQLLEMMDNARPQLLERYRSAVFQSSLRAPDEESRETMIASQGTYGALTGEAAIFLRDLRTQVEEFRNRIPSATVFQRRFTERFANTPGLTAPLTRGGIESGSLWLNMRIHRERHGEGDDSYWSIRIENNSSSWELATTAPQSSRLAQSLSDTIRGSVANTSLPKYLNVRVVTERFGLNDYERAIIYFRNPENPDFRGWNVGLSRWVWEQPYIKRTALSVTRITAR
jgi:hypothetical protein